MSDLITLVTGASSGIGRAVCERLLEDGHHVIGMARDFGKFPCDSTAFTPLTVDLGDLNTLPEHLRALPAELTGVVCSAGQGRFGALEQFSYDQIRSLIEIDLTGQLFVARAALPLLKARGRGDLLFVGSESSLRGAAQGAVYCAAKFGLRGLAQALRAECAKSGVRVSLVNPGMVRTSFFDTLDFEPGPEPDNAIAPEQVANAVAMVLAAPPGIVFDEIQLTPLKRVVRKKPKS